MKQTIEWHSECLRNMVKHAMRLRDMMDRATDDYVRFRESCLFRERQIAEAVKQGRDGFDDERFMVKKLGALKGEK